jgi:hypothetical protein
LSDECTQVWIGGDQSDLKPAASGSPTDHDSIYLATDERLVPRHDKRNAGSIDLRQSPLNGGNVVGKTYL